MLPILEGYLQRLEMLHTEIHTFNRECTVAWCLAHALEHTAVHVGQMQITRQLWDQK